MKYPKYKREEKLSAKLSNDDIVEINKLRLSGLGLRKIADKYKVSHSTIWFACLNEEQLKEHYKNIYKRNKNYYSKDYHKQADIRGYKRKKILQGDKLSNYYRNEKRIKIQKDYYIKNREDELKKNKEYYKQNKNKIAERSRLRRLKNIEITREKEREYRNKNIERCRLTSKKSYYKNREKILARQRERYYKLKI